MNATTETPKATWTVAAKLRKLAEYAFDRASVGWIETRAALAEGTETANDELISPMRDGLDRLWFQLNELADAFEKFDPVIAVAESAAFDPVILVSDEPAEPADDEAQS